MLSVRDESPSWALAQAPCSLLRQAHAKRGRYQRDGWGAGWYGGDAKEPELFKRSATIYRDKAALNAALREARGRIVIAHIRRASNPRKLPRKKIQGLENTQPFSHGPFLFAHNGTVNFPVEFARLLGPWRKQLQGVNDSEVLFWLIVRHLVRTGDFAAAYASAARAMRQMWRRFPAAKRARPPFNGLNVILSDGKTLHAATYFESTPSLRPTALARDNWPFWQLAYRTHRNGIIVASEPLDRTGRKWRALPPNHVLSASIRSGRVTLETTPLVV